MKTIPDIRLAMTILARDEADIIESNIRFHAAAGVEKFVVTDNSSLDGTREILAELSTEFDIKIIDEPSLTIDQDLWVSRMANWVKENDHCDWIINNDADEFWFTGNGCLRSAISESLASSTNDIGVFTCSRQNMIGSRESTSKEGYDFYKNKYAVVKNLMPDCADTKWSERNGNIVIRKLPGKVITRVAGLKSIGMGNHGAVHEGSKEDCGKIKIYHYPIRSYEQFQKKVVNYGSSLEKNERFSENISSHLRYWYECHKEGSLREQYDLFVLTENELSELCNSGVLQVDERIQNCYMAQRELAA